MPIKEKKQTPQKDRLGGLERIKLYRTLHDTPIQVINDPQLLEWFYILFGKPIIHTINSQQKDNSVYYIWFIPPVIATVAKGHFSYSFKTKQMHYEYQNRKYLCRSIIISREQALKLSKTDESIISIRPKSRLDK